MPCPSFLPGRLTCLLAAATLAVGTPILSSALLAQPADTAAPISAASDGPYVMRTGSHWTARRIASDLKETATPVDRGDKIRIGAVAEVPSFEVRLRPPVTTRGADRLALDAQGKLLVLADTHGEYEIVIAFLKKQGVIDDRLKWAFGKGQMVVTGDMFDRGAHQLEILWLLYKLEGEARKAGGALHVLLGNHESMVLRGDLRYLHPRYPESARILGLPNYSALFTQESVLGNWLRSRPAVQKLGDMLFLHGGISPAIVDAGIGIDGLNKGIATALDTPAEKSAALDERSKLVTGSEGPQWYRGYFAAPDKRTSDADIDRALKAYGVSRIFVGHTPVEQVTPLYDGKVIAVQVYPHRDEATQAPVLEGALREKGVWYRVGATGVREKLAVPGQ